MGLFLEAMVSDTGKNMLHIDEGKFENGQQMNRTQNDKI